jgi:SAM-dependent methyltransferase
MKLDATQVQLESEAVRTSDAIRRRYRENANWRYFPKEWIYKNIPIEGKDVLDFGCGTGEIATQLAFLGANKVYALDVTPGLLDHTRRRAELDEVSDRVETICGMVQDVEAKPVDVVIAFAVLHHCFPLERMMPSLIRWLKPGGVFIAVEPVSYLKSLEALRHRSGVPFDPLDEGERKLNPTDLQYVASFFPKIEIVHFHVFGRLTRLMPSGDMFFRKLDQLLLKLPGFSKFAGTALIVGRLPA